MTMDLLSELSVIEIVEALQCVGSANCLDIRGFVTSTDIFNTVFRTKEYSDIDEFIKAADPCDLTDHMAVILLDGWTVNISEQSISVVTTSESVDKSNCLRELVKLAEFLHNQTDSSNYSIMLLNTAVQAREEGQFMM